MEEVTLEQSRRMVEFYSKLYSKLKTTFQEMTMSETLQQKGDKEKKVHIAEVVRHGEKIVLPSDMDIKDAISTLQRREAYESEMVEINHDFPAFVWDGAYALSKVMEERYGWVTGEAQWGGMFGMEKEPPQLIGVEVNYGKSVQVPFGKFRVPSVKHGEFFAEVRKRDNRFYFKLRAVVQRQHEGEVQKLRDQVADYLQGHSIYRGKAISMKFNDSAGQPLALPTPQFLDLSMVREDELVFPHDVDDSIRTNLFTPIERMDEARSLKVPIKRGVMFVGDYGVGKTLCAYVAAKKSVKHRITFIYCQDPKEFAGVMRFAAQYSPAVVFCEDIDRVAPNQRDAAVDEITLIMDGVETKSCEIITVLTTNEVKRVNEALLRPGRLDAVIEIRRPDAEAAQRLIRLYGRHLVRENEDLTRAGELLAGNIPAVIREVVERSKLAALRRLSVGVPLDHVPAVALEESAKTMKMQIELLANQHKHEPSESQLCVEIFGREVGAAIRDVGENIRDGVLDRRKLKEEAAA